MIVVIALTEETIRDNDIKTVRAIRRARKDRIPTERYLSDCRSSKPYITPT